MWMLTPWVANSMSARLSILASATKMPKMSPKNKMMVSASSPPASVAGAPPMVKWSSPPLPMSESPNSPVRHCRCHSVQTVGEPGSGTQRFDRDQSLRIAEAVISDGLIDKAGFTPLGALRKAKPAGRSRPAIERIGAPPPTSRRRRLSEDRVIAAGAAKGGEAVAADNIPRTAEKHIVAAKAKQGSAPPRPVNRFAPLSPNMASSMTCQSRFRCSQTGPCFESRRRK